MKKENITLLKFLSVILVAVIAGTAAGYMAYPLAQGQIFLPQALFAGPVLVFISLAAVVSMWRNHSIEKLQQPVILSITGFGAVLSGFCGWYTLADVPLVAVTVAVFFTVIILALWLQNRKTANQVTGAFHTSVREKICSLAMFVIMFVSVSVPVGPLPAVACGMTWLITVDKKL